MAKRLRIVILYFYSENWIGGTYYIQNLVSALNKIEDARKPQLLIASDSVENYQSLKQLTNYPYLKYVNLIVARQLVFRLINKVGRIILKKNLISNDFSKFDLFFQTGQTLKSNVNKKVLYWIPDFQEHYLPGFFSADEIDTRKNFQCSVALNGRYIVFSSEDAKKDFDKFYPESSLTKYVLPFAVTHPAFDDIASIKDLLKKYNLPEEYFICSNQFWLHKNHRIILEAIRELKQSGIYVTVAFSGKEYDHRFPDYAASLKKICKEFGIEDNVRYLGFIDRGEQLNLMKHSQAIIQPSFFEGWSTVVEDAKALGVNIFASNIGVHKEQLKEYKQVLLFDPYNEKELADCFLKKICKSSYNYDQSILNYANNFVDMINLIAKDK